MDTTLGETFHPPSKMLATCIEYMHNGQGTAGRRLAQHFGPKNALHITQKSVLGTQKRTHKWGQIPATENEPWCKLSIMKCAALWTPIRAL